MYTNVVQQHTKKQKRYLDWLALQKELEYGDCNTQTRKAIIRSTLKHSFDMEIVNTKRKTNQKYNRKKEQTLQSRTNRQKKNSKQTNNWMWQANIA